MRKLTKEEVAQLHIVKGRSTPVRTEVLKLKTGEFLEVKKGEWVQKNSPIQMLQTLEKRFKHKYEMHTLADKTGWVIERLA